MTDADTAAGPANAGALIGWWQASGTRTHQVAAELAAKITAGRWRRWDELPSAAALADEYDVSVGTVAGVKRLLAEHKFLVLADNRRYYVAGAEESTAADLMRDWQPDLMHPNLSTPDGLRTWLEARYRHIALTFDVSSEPEKFQAAWNGGSAVEDSEAGLLDKVLEELQDCGTAKHEWVTTDEKPDPGNDKNLLRIQRLECVYCDSRERVITVSADTAWRPE